MASHLTITPAASNGTVKGLNTQANGAAEVENGVAGVFAALLGAANQTTPTTASAEGSVDMSLGNLVNLSLGAGFGEEDGDKTEDPEAVAAVVDATLPIQNIPVTPALTDLVDSLTELKQGLAAGDAINPELLKRIDTALNDIAAQFNIDIAALPSLDDLKAMTAAIVPGDTSLDAQLTAAIAPLAESLISGSATPEVSADVELSTLVKSIGEKLAALLQSINSDDIDPNKLAALGLDADVNLQTDLEAAITKLLNPPVKVDATANAQLIATPQLKLTEPVLTGKATTDAPAPTTADAVPEATTDAKLQVAATATSGRPDSNADNGKSQSDDDSRKPIEAKAQATVAVATTADAPVAPDPQASAQTVHQASRIDAAAARPVIQPGYQTSQQQLNLPQLAFELVRQVNDGNTRFQMRLDPPELGKIDVKLDIDSTGQVNAKLVVERAETLDLMQRDQRGLERALQQAGLDSSKTNLEFSLKQSPFSGGNQQGQNGNGGQPRFGGDITAEAEDTPAPMVNLYRGSLMASGVNIIA